MPEIKSLSRPTRSGRGVFLDIFSDLGRNLQEMTPQVDAGIGRVVTAYGIGGPIVAATNKAAFFYGIVAAGEAPTVVGASAATRLELRNAIQHGLLTRASSPKISPSAPVFSGDSQQTTKVQKQIGGVQEDATGVAVVTPPMGLRDP